MTIFEKIKTLYPEINDVDFANGVIVLRDDSDGRGVYLKEWNHPTFQQPTEEQLKG